MKEKEYIMVIKNELIELFIGSIDKKELSKEIIKTIKNDLEIIRFLLTLLLIWCGVLSWAVFTPIVKGHTQPKVIPTYIINSPPPLEIIDDIELL